MYLFDPVIRAKNCSWLGTPAQGTEGEAAIAPYSARVLWWMESTAVVSGANLRGSRGADGLYERVQYFLSLTLTLAGSARLAAPSKV